MKFLLVYVAFSTASLGLLTEASAEGIDISLGASSVRDPLLLYRFPEKPSRDSMRFSSGGLLIDQPADSNAREPDVVGFKVASSIRGDFEFSLDVECLKLTQPESGWGHGLVTKLVFAADDKPLVSMGCISTPRFEKAYRVTIESGAEKPTFKTDPCTFKSGVWNVARSGSEIVFSVKENGVATEIHRSDYTNAELLEVQVWANRLPKDNGHAKFLLKSLTLSGDEFFARSEVTRSHFGMWAPFFIAASTCLLLVVVYVVRRRQ
ncbi:MAG: hypothetical protein Aurels2KO_21760 [Aureliella sp.]